jgi:ubiquinone biosynthesis protein
MAGPRRIVGDKEKLSLRLREALESLGPVFTSFGLYLSTRADLLLATDCLELSAISDLIEPLPVETVIRLFAAEFGCEPEEVFEVFESEPMRSGLLYQLHRAQLKDGAQVIVKISRLDVFKSRSADLEIVGMLARTRAGVAWGEAPMRSVVEDFRLDLAERLNLIGEAESFEALGADARAFGLLGAPRPLGRLCSSRIIVFERLEGMTLEAVFENGEEVDRSDLARRLCRVWLRQALLGSRFPAAPRPQNVILMPDGRIAFAGGGLTTLRRESQTNLRQYLVSSSTQELDKACESLLREMDEERGRAKADDVQRRFKQIQPFRDGGWNSESSAESLAEQLMAQWLVATREGCKPTSHLVSFYRGLFSTVSMAERLAPGRDSLLIALEEVRLLEVIEQFQSLVFPQELGGKLEKYAMMMAELPRRMDEILNLTSEGPARIRLQVNESPAQRRRRNSMAVVIALLLALLAVALITRHLSAAGVEWAEKAGAVVMILAGAAALMSARRAR